MALVRFCSIPFCSTHRFDMVEGTIYGRFNWTWISFDSFICPYSWSAHFSLPSFQFSRSLLLESFKEDQMILFLKTVLFYLPRNRVFVDLNSDFFWNANLWLEIIWSLLYFCRHRDRCCCRCCWFLLLLVFSSSYSNAKQNANVINACSFSILTLKSRRTLYFGSKHADSNCIATTEEEEEEKMPRQSTATITTMEMKKKMNTIMVCNERIVAFCKMQETHRFHNVTALS